MIALRKAAQSVIQAWDEPAGTTGVCRALDDLRAALAEPTIPSDCPYSHQPQREPLTDQEINNLRHLIDQTADWSYFAFARAIEKAHGIGGKDEQ